MKIYLAAPWPHRGDAATAALAIEAAGHTITEPWWTHPECDDHDELVRQAMKDIEGVAAADFVIVLQLAQSEGKAAETGMAMMMAKPIVIVNPNWVAATYQERGGNLFHHLLTVVPTLEEALVKVVEFEQAFAKMIAEYQAKLLDADAKLATAKGAGGKE